MQCNAGTSHGVPIAALLGPPEVVADLDRGTVKVRSGRLGRWVGRWESPPAFCRRRRIGAVHD
jgi:hypothetical protein